MQTEEETLDPQNWDELRKLGHQMIDDMMGYLKSLRDSPAWRPVPEGVRRAIGGTLPTEPQSYESVYNEFVDHVLPYPNGNIHPRFWGWVQGTGTPFAMLADMLASGMNPHMAGFEQAPAIVEETVMEWLKKLMGFPESASGLLVSGCTMANLTALMVARNQKAGVALRENGLQGTGNATLVAYASSEMHCWAQKAMDVLGLGSRNLRIIPVDEDYRLSKEELAQSIHRDRALGLQPFCILATAGTVNTGAIDNLDALADLAEQENLWFHIDGAFGALARLSPRHSRLLNGMERANSLAFDLHKWMYLPFEVGCVLIKDPAAHHKTFAQTAHYISAVGRGVMAGALQFSDLGIELTRGFKALKVWMSLKAHGSLQLGRIIGQNIDQAQHLAKLIQNSPNLTLLAKVSLNVVCFRYHVPNLEENLLTKLNQEILIQLQEKGYAVPSATTLAGKFGLRVAIVNHRSIRSDFDFLVNKVEELGQEILKNPPWEI